MIRKKWHLWSFLLRYIARTQGFLDPVAVFSNLQRFSKPSEVWVPTELLRSGAILQARGLMNSQAIQNNLDWIWPYWAHRQFDPTDKAFIPRAFSMTHINLTHRNWTAVGIPDFDEFSIVDPRGLVTPFYDGWSIDAWIIQDNKNHLIPSFFSDARQQIFLKNTLAIETSLETNTAWLMSRAEVTTEGDLPVCRMTFAASSDSKSWLAIALRPYNPEGVSFVHSIELLPEKNGWKVNGEKEVYFNRPASRHIFSNYSSGDAFLKIFADHEDLKEVKCDVGMSTAVALYEIEGGNPREVLVRVPLLSRAKARAKTNPVLVESWRERLRGHCRLEIPDKQFQFLYETAVETLILHSPGDVYPGPYTYKRFWFRDAAFILNAMLCVGLTNRVEKVLDRFPSRQTPGGHFLSQDGEWDSNGQALWILGRFCRCTGQKPKPTWRHAIRQGGYWIKRKRLSSEKDAPHAGLLPAGFSAEHLGPNDFYYWDDFWGVAGLRAAAWLIRSWEEDVASEFENDVEDFMGSIERSLAITKKRLGHEAIPASPYRRMDAGAIGSITAGYPLQLWESSDSRILATVRFLTERCFLNGGFYQEISHSGINAYLTLHVAQVLLRAGDSRYLDLAYAIASMATSTGQWPEAIHPRTEGGCMGDGQHVWASAEWVLLMRNFFVREEENKSLILCSGIPQAWCHKGKGLFMGPIYTSFGKISISVEFGTICRVSWEAEWHDPPSRIEIRMPGYPVVFTSANESSVELKGGLS